MSETGSYGQMTMIDHVSDNNNKNPDQRARYKYPVIVLPPFAAPNRLPWTRGDLLGLLFIG